MPQSTLPPQFVLPPVSQQLIASSHKPRGHARSRSDYVSLGAPSDPSHPFKKLGNAPTPPNRSNNNRPPRGAPQPPALLGPPQLQSTLSPLSFGSPVSSRKNNAHRRAKSDIPLALFRGSGGSISGGGGRVLVTKEDLLKNLPNPRWGGAPKPLTHVRNRSRTGSGSDGPMLDDISVKSGYSGYGATSSSGEREYLMPTSQGSEFNPLLQSIGSVELGPNAKKTQGRHVRAMSDASAISVTTDMAKSALFKGITDTGRIQLQLPKDSFRILMDSQLEAGMVYKRKLVDSEDEFFVEFHTVDEDPVAVDGDTCNCTCDRCMRCHEKQKRLPPDLYVMAVDSTIYRRMLDEVIASRSMPCGTFFCGHHEDVRHPDITIAALIVSVVVFLLLAGTTLL
ncbi:hypothetical protein ACHAXR_009521 [Thalassiosira sp. AJA248-18]